MIYNISFGEDHQVFLFQLIMYFMRNVVSLMTVSFQKLQPISLRMLLTDLKNHKTLQLKIKLIFNCRK